MAFRPLKSQRLYQQLADGIKTQIIQGELGSGNKLPNERELSEKFGVSRTVVREAMKALAQEGLIEIQPGRGTYVVYQIMDAVKDLLAIWRCLKQNSSGETWLKCSNYLSQGLPALQPKGQNLNRFWPWGRP